MTIAISFLKFASGFISNLACQSARSLFNLLGFVIFSFVALALFTLASLRILGGGLKVGRQTALESWSFAKKSFKMLFFSILQAVGTLTLLGPLVRGSQACSECLKPTGIYAPKKPSNIWQLIFGLNSWQQAECEEKAKQINPEEGSGPNDEEKPTTKRTVDKRRSRPRPKMKVVRKSDQNKDWADLSRKYLGARSREEMDAVRAEMAIRHPILYAKTLLIAQKIGRRKKVA